MTVGTFSPAAVGADAVAAGLVWPIFQSRVQRVSPAGFEFHSVPAGPFGPLSFVPPRRGGYQASDRRRPLGRPSSSRLLYSSLLVPTKQ